MKNILTMENVSHTYHTDAGETLAVSRLSLSVCEGEFVVVIGPSGCGKTTVLSLMAGLITPTDGRVMLCEEEVSRSRERPGYMLQRDELFPWRTIERNVMLPLEIKSSSCHASPRFLLARRKKPPKSQENVEFANSLLQKYGLWKFKKSYPDELSGGMRQRAALIRTLALRPKILLLDEPFSALDYQTRLNVVGDVYKIIRREKKTAVLVTHDISEAISVADRIIVLTSRPATVLRDYPVRFEGGLSPLERREHPDFRLLFEKLWRDLNDESNRAN